MAVRLAVWTASRTVAWTAAQSEYCLVVKSAVVLAALRAAKKVGQKDA